MIIPTALFVLSGIFLVTPLVFYPLILTWVAQLKKPHALSSGFPDNTKLKFRISLIISAYNEEACIRAKIENSLSLDFGTENKEIIVISDASTDGTDDIVREFQDRGVKIFRQAERLGKSAGLSRYCPEAGGDIIVFTDANSIYQPDAIAKLCRHFSDPNVGYAVGRQLYKNTGSTQETEPELIYWNLELYLKRLESRVSSVVGADGAIFAMRKNLFSPLEPEDINDFLLPLKIVAMGFRGVFEPQAVCFEETAKDLQGEFRRKYRIVNRSVRAVLKSPSTLNPFKVGWFSMQLFAHKILRWLTPVFLLTFFFSNLYLVMNIETSLTLALALQISLAAQISLFLAASCYCLRFCRNLKIVALSYYYMLMNAAALWGIAKLTSGKLWQLGNLNAEIDYPQIKHVLTSPHRIAPL